MTRTASQGIGYARAAAAPAFRHASVVGYGRFRFRRASAAFGRRRRPEVWTHSKQSPSALARVGGQAP